jgi:hypothetical protein
LLLGITTFVFQYVKELSKQLLALSYQLLGEDVYGLEPTVPPVYGYILIVKELVID